MTFEFIADKTLPEVKIIVGKEFKDDRGFFSEIFREDAFVEQGLPRFVQINHSRSSGECIRGLHYQLPPKAQAKLVYCISGSIWDVAVDIRKGSPTYKKSTMIPLGDWTIPTAVYIP